MLALFDEDEYRNKSRDFWIDPLEPGFLIAKNQDELNQILLKLYSYNHFEIAKKINSFYGTSETGCASIILAERIVKLLNKQ